MSASPDKRGMPEHPASHFTWRRHSFSGQRWPRNRIVRSFLIVVPWIDLVAAAVLIWCLGRQVLIQPGRVVELPQADLQEGLPAHCQTAVLRRLLAPGREGCTVLLLDEGRYSSDNPRELKALDEMRVGGEINLVADVAIPYGDVLQWVERLRACGAERVNLVEVPPQASGE